VNAELQTRARPRCFCTWTPPPQAQDGHGSAVPLQGLGAGQIRQARFHCRGGPPCPPARGTPSPPPVGGSAIRRRGKQARGYTCLLPLWLPAVSGSSGEPYRELGGDRSQFLYRECRGGRGQGAGLRWWVRDAERVPFHDPPRCGFHYAPGSGDVKKKQKRGCKPQAQIHRSRPRSRSLFFPRPSTPDPQQGHRQLRAMSRELRASQEGG